MTKRKTPQEIQEYIRGGVDYYNDCGRYKRGDLCDCWQDCQEKCGSEQCTARLIDFYYGSDSDEDN